MTIKGAMVAASVAGMFTLAAPLAAQAKPGKVACQGVNECKGKSGCKSASNDCKGQNDCKGKGWVKTTAKDCAAKGGTVATADTKK